MSVKIRLARGGSKKRPFYAIVIADSRSPRDGRFIEKIGTYNPLLPKESGERVKFDAERAKHWLSKGAEATERVHHFLAVAGLVQPKARRDDPKQSKPKAKAQERAREAAEKAAA